MGWRQIGQTVHLSALRRIARQNTKFPDPANTAHLKLRAGDIVAVTAGHHPHTGAIGGSVRSVRACQEFCVSASSIESMSCWY